ncbi:MAG: TIGR02587 family membrane protein [Ilumatobacteraceae bacterium]
MTEARAGWATEVTDLVRAASGGLLFGIPLLFTVEVLWTGQHTSPTQMVVLLLAAFVPLLVLNRTEGFRSNRDVRLRDALVDAIEGVALSIVLVVATLVLIGEIRGETPLQVMLGKMANEVLPVCIGIGVARHLLRQNEDRDSTDDDRVETAGSQRMNATLADLGASTIGSVFIALSIAPTDEVPLLAASRSPLWLLAIMAASILVAYAIVFVAGFSGQNDRHAQQGVLQHPVTETLTSYVVALFAGLAMLKIFQRADGPLRDTVAQVIVLGLPAAIGGAAGRLAV